MMRNRQIAPRLRAGGPWLPAAVLICLLGLLAAGCSRDDGSSPTAPAGDGQAALKAIGSGEFTFEAKYDYIMSYPGGGGIFVLRIAPGEGFTGDVELSLAANKLLGAELSTTVVNAASPVAEITVAPGRKMPIGEQTVTVTAANATGSVDLDLVVDVIDWGGGVDSTARQKQVEFLAWLKAEHPELGNLTRVKWDSYATYPGILIVGHETFLSEEWEFRVCYHVMIPPYDWSKMMIRRRGEWDGALAAVREWDEPAQDYLISEMPVEDYPVIYGY